MTRSTNMLLHSICLYILKKWQRWGFTQSMVYCIFHSMPPKISFWRGKYILVMFQFEKHLEFTFCRTMWRNIWGPALFLAPARKGTDQQNLFKLDSIWKSCTLYKHVHATFLFYWHFNRHGQHWLSRRHKSNHRSFARVLIRLYILC